MGDITGLELVETRLRAKVQIVKRRGNTIQAQCPAHADRNPSLSVGLGKDRDVVMKCFAGCSSDDIMAVLGLEWTDLGERKTRQASTETAVYTYTDEVGKPLYRVHRTSDKRFWQDHLSVHGEWVRGLADTRRVLYHLPDVLAAAAMGKTIWIAEGEKDVDRLRAEGVQATCNSGGAGKFTEDHADALAGATVVIVADRDRPGFDHASLVRRMLTARQCDVRVVVAAKGKDASDHLGAGLPMTAFLTVDPDKDDPTPVAWDDPKPLSTVDAPPAFPLEVLPDWMAWHASSVASELQVPVDLPAMLGLVALAVISAGKAEVEIKGTWREQLNLYLTVAMPPGSGKSPAFKAMLSALDEWELELSEGIDHDIELAEQRKRIAEKAMKRAEDSGDFDEARRMLVELQGVEVPKRPRLSADDATPEALAGLLHEQKGRLALLSTEGGVFDLMTGRYSDRANLDVYLQAWAGDTIRIDRVSREAVTIRKPALTIGLTVQPSVLERLSEHPELKGRGLTARFMYSVPPDCVGTRNMIDAPSADPEARRQYDVSLLGLARRLNAYQMPGTLRFAPEARKVFDGWRQGLEDRRVPNGDLRPLAEWTTKLESSVARLAGLLHLAETGEAQGEVDTPQVERAIVIGEYWLAHARIVHDMWDADPTVDDARRMLKWMQRNRLEEFSVRDLQRGVKSFKAVEDLRAGLELLTDSGWIRPQFEGELVLGRPGVNSPRYLAHPHICGLSPVRNNHVSLVPHVPRDKNNSLSLSLSREGNTGTRGHEGHGRQVPEASPDAVAEAEQATVPPRVVDSLETFDF